MKNLFRSRSSSQSLTLLQIQKLSSQSNLSPGEIEKWYEHFIRCYTSGYVSFEEFHMYIKQLSIYHGNQQQSQISKSLVKELFSNLDFNNDRRLNFEEFFRFILLMNQDSVEDKLKFILNLYDPRREIRFTREEIVTILTNMFYILDMSKSINQLPEKLDYIFKSINLNNQICWNTFSVSLFNHSILFQLLLSNHFDPNTFEENFTTQF
jgi:Ca2+-binding EF-hand superfamily protein